MFTLRFDMRAPASGAPPVELYAAAPEMCAWAERHGCLAAVLCEHHGSEDGYLPSPLILASAIAARTERLALSLILILPFYDPVRLAEDMAVLDIISDGRASYILALGYRPEEFEHFGVEVRDRGRLADEKLALLRELLAGETWSYDGRRITVTPRPQTAGGPRLMWGGGSVAAARRAGRYGLGMLANANVPGMREAYEAACREHGHEPGAVLSPDRDTPSVCFVADDVDQAWSELGEYLLHDVRGYAAWNPGNETSAGISFATNRRRAARQVDVARDLLGGRSHRAGPRRRDLNLSPLCGGLPPEIAWPYLKRVGEVVLPCSGCTSRRRRMTGDTTEVYYDPFDFDIDDDPYPIWKRLRDEAPLYHNEKYNFYALSRYEDVARELTNWDTYRSGRGTTMDIIMSGIEVPPGVILFEDPPMHDLHRRLLSRVFTPRRMEAIEPLTRDFCVRALDPLMGTGRFDFIENIGAMVPMRTIGYLLGIPEENQEDDPRHAAAAITLKEGDFGGFARTFWSTAMRCSPTTSIGGSTIPPTI